MQQLQTELSLLRHLVLRFKDVNPKYYMDILIGLIIDTEQAIKDKESNITN